MRTSDRDAIATKTIKNSFRGRRAATLRLAHLLKLVYASLVLFPMSVSALVIGDDGPEPVIVQLKQSLRTSDDLDAKLTELALLERQCGVAVIKRWAGPKYLELISFPKDFTEDQALAVVAKLQKLPSLEKVVALSAFNLEFKSGDFVRAYLPGDAIPDVARRGFDVDRLTRPAAAALPDPDLAVRSPHVPNHIIVRWKDEYAWKADQTGARERINRFHARAGCWVHRESNSRANTVLQTLEFDSSVSTVADKLRQYKDLDWVDYVQPDYIYSTNSVPNDPYYTSPGQPNLTTISAPAAWSDQTGNQSLVLAVGDSGANVSHPDFAPPGLTPNLSPGSYNFLNDTSNVTDDFAGVWHGSAMASIIGAKGNNGRFMTGIAWNVSLLILKVVDSQNHTDPVTISNAITYAYADPSHQPAIAINLSLGFPHSSSLDPTLSSAAQDAKAADMLIVAAAGNSGLNQEDPGNLASPADIPFDNVLAVGATDGDDRLYFSDYGRYRVELGAPGVNILGLQQSPTANLLTHSVLELHPPLPK
jgi:thermitase